MLKELEKLFGFRTSETTNVAYYLERMDTMGKLDAKKQNELLGSIIKRLMDLETRLESLENARIANVDGEDELSKRLEKLEKAIDNRDIPTMKADITRLKKKLEKPTSK